MSGSASPPPSGRTIDIELGGQEVITVELDTLDEQPDDVIEVLKEGQCKVWIWTRLASEYWRRGHLDAAEKIAKAAIESAWFGWLGYTKCNSYSVKTCKQTGTTVLFHLCTLSLPTCRSPAQRRLRNSFSQMLVRIRLIDILL